MNPICPAESTSWFDTNPACPNYAYHPEKESIEKQDDPSELGENREHGSSIHTENNTEYIDIAERYYIEISPEDEARIKNEIYALQSGIDLDLGVLPPGLDDLDVLSSGLDDLGVLPHCLDELEVISSGLDVLGVLPSGLDILGVLPSGLDDLGLLPPPPDIPCGPGDPAPELEILPSPPTPLECYQYNLLDEGNLPSPPELYQNSFTEDISEVYYVDYNYIPEPSLSRPGKLGSPGDHLHVLPVPSPHPLDESFDFRDLPEPYQAQSNSSTHASRNQSSTDEGKLEQQQKSSKDKLFELG